VRRVVASCDRPLQGGPGPRAHPRPCALRAVWTSTRRATSSRPLRVDVPADAHVRPSIQPPRNVPPRAGPGPQQV